MKKRILSLSLAIILCIGLCAPAMAAVGEERGTLRYEQVISPQYEDAKPFSEGLAAVKKNGKWGYIDRDNKQVIPFQYDVAFNFSEGYAVVGKYSTRMDWNGDQAKVIELGFVSETGAYKPFRGMLYEYAYNVDVYTDYYCFEYTLDESFDYRFYGGWVAVGGWIFDTAGNQFGGDEYAHFEPRRGFTEGLAVAWPEYTDGLAYVDISGNVVIDLSDTFTEIPGGYKYISNAYPFNQGLAVVWECTVVNENESYKFGLIDKSGNWVIPPTYENYRYMGQQRHQLFADNGLFSVDKGGKSGCIDKTGNVIIPFIYDRVWSFYEGLAVFELNGKSGYLDSAGNIVIPAKYEKASGFSNGYAVVYDGAKAFLIDRAGNTIPGADVLDPNNYFIEHEDGSKTVVTPGEYVVIRSGSQYGYGRIEYLPPLPAESEMSGWAYEEVTAAIEEELVPVYLQNMYFNNITRAEFSALVIQAVTETLGVERNALVLQKTGKRLSEWIHSYPFNDTSDADIIAANALGIINGYGDGTFAPYAQISRQEAAAMLTRAAKVLGMTTTGAPNAGFADSSSIASWSADSVNFVFKIGVMNGTGGNSFSPLGTYTREQSYVTVYRLFLASGK